MTTFINIHALISHPSSMMNRDDSGLQKTAVFGGTTRSRISSQCLKRAIRQSDLYKKDVEELSIRTNRFDDLLKLCIEKLPEFDAKTIESVLENMGSKIKTETDKDTKDKRRYFDAVQPYSLGAIREAINIVQAGTDLKELKKIVQLPTIDVALSGRMDASCPERNVEAAMSVAHSLTTHSADIEVDWFTACDDLAEQGSGHIGTNEFSSGVFYRYASINVDLLAQNIKKSIEETAFIITTIVNCFAQVSPSAKQKTFAAHNKADFVLCTSSNQPLSLANAFRKPIPNTGEVMEASIQSLVSHYEKLVDGYDLESKAKAFDMTNTAQSEKITMVNKVSELAF
ncbi:type I-E CRISPR-associated protein Cas7/Cse4/CasC [Pseudoalteromonas sp. SG45-5]|jgi:CRISPR system Cascade subunit CasC|uniref:type I-E CRISPR-associated protein Cas7/Cse4/CasC n=1 Tax=unclassified Pseudoalteromonas TaxID=194690 RepID=UPI0015F7CB2B|nr:MULTISPECIES: type I-E CRISPR-associated protein Cas7/Cse4/CasC [unclassified Pseudoalteromonas]MBB1385289.1 type I-E CRISPR-associated protein Cas7/Cse4/CasC [Pseudoalteromonas sp. SG45-5]MBB1394923.1 type I-E CRISPR-associated protein Cas7/Cse4/CasC [Pseudoalteromonas sp. SG44-4]MBB1448422.1 type I-E CRISPR-associated protein Cas7/Cse4/CasC [Pseudoalteromonas sp. SG41-6]